MHVIFDIGLEPFSLRNKYGGIILFLVIACLALVPLAMLHFMLAVTCFVVSEKASDEVQNGLTIAQALVALQICAQATLYFSLIFPFMVALLSTFGCYHTLEARERRRSRSSTNNHTTVIWLYLRRYKMVRQQRPIFIISLLFAHLFANQLCDRRN